MKSVIPAKCSITCDICGFEQTTTVGGVAPGFQKDSKLTLFINGEWTYEEDIKWDICDKCSYDVRAAVIGLKQNANL